MKQGSKVNNLSSAWWADTTAKISGLVLWKQLKPLNPGLPLNTQLKSAIEQISASNPAERRMKKMDIYLRTACKPLLQHELCEVLNRLAEAHRRTCKFATDFGTAVAKHITKFDLHTIFKDEV